MPVKKVLIVDDERDIVNLLVDLLGHCGLEVKSANDAGKALSILEFMRFDIIITDHTMPPGIDGVEFTRIVKSMYPATVVIGISGHPYSDVFLNAGADVFLSKPIDFEELLSIIGQ